MKSIRQLVVALVVVMVAALLVMPTFAQDTSTPTPKPPTTGSETRQRPAGNGGNTQPAPRTLTITQEQINVLLSMHFGDRLKDLSIKLGDNQVTVSFTTKGGTKNEAGLAIVAVVTPGVTDGKVSWTLNSLTVNGTAATQEQTAKFKDRVTNLLAGKLAPHERRFTINSISVTSSAITITATRNKNG